MGCGVDRGFYPLCPNQPLTILDQFINKTNYIYFAAAAAIKIEMVGIEGLGGTDKGNNTTQNGWTEMLIWTMFNYELADIGRVKINNSILVWKMFKRVDSREGGGVVMLRICSKPTKQIPQLLVYIALSKNVEFSHGLTEFQQNMWDIYIQKSAEFQLLCEDFPAEIKRYFNRVCWKGMFERTADWNVRNAYFYSKRVDKMHTFFEWRSAPKALLRYRF